MRIVVLLFLFLIAGPVAVGAQDTGMVRGRVTDWQTGRGIAGAIVSARSPSGYARTKTDRNGFYVFLSLPTAGTTISAVYPGYEDSAVRDVCVQSDQVRVVPLALLLPAPTINPLISSSTYSQWRCRFGGD